MDKKEIINLTRSIIKKNFPNQELSFEIDHEDLIEKIENKESISVLDTSSGDFKFGESITEIIPWISVLLATMNTTISVLKYRKTIRDEKKKSSIEIHEKWISYMKSAGLSENQAENIANQHFPEFEKLLNNENS